MNTFDELKEGDIWYDPTKDLNEEIDLELFLNSLPKREADFLAMKIDGHSNDEIAEALSLSPKTIDRLTRWLKVKFEE